jgi:hypothetical protein
MHHVSPTNEKLFFRAKRAPQMWKEEVMDRDQRSKNVAELFGEGLGDAALVMARPFFPL